MNHADQTVSRREMPLRRNEPKRLTVALSLGILRFRPYLDNAETQRYINVFSQLLYCANLESGLQITPELPHKHGRYQPSRFEQAFHMIHL